jgi:D-alanyl-D-alanine carboxypeptidase (penicillin-binding protein 5/6)
MSAFFDWNARAARLLCLTLAVLFLVSWQSAPVQASSDTAHKKVHSVSKSSKSKHAVSEQAASSGKRKRHGRHSRHAVAAPDAESGFHLNVKAAYLLNLTNGKVYYTQNPDERIPPASITKVLTLYLVREALAQGRIKENTLIPVTALAIRTGGSTMTLYKGENVPLSEIIKGISVVSANNACVAVAQYLGKGDTRRFVGQMNATARRLGMSRSVFRNPNGLPASGQFSTAHDIACLSSAYLKRFPESLAIHSMTTHTYNGVTHHNANSLLGRVEGVDGLKTGFVCASGYNITATAKRGNTRLVAVLLGARNPIIREVEATRLLDYGFARTASDTSAPAVEPSRPHHRKSHKHA